MARRRKKADSTPSNAYLISFGDTMTTLLAFFIVLNSLAEDQTGVNLYSGTGSFIRAFDSVGFGGYFAKRRTAAPFQLVVSGPLYLPPMPEGAEPDNFASGPDANGDNLRIIDREAEEFERFMNEMNRFFVTQPHRQTRGEVVLDIFTPLPKEAPYWREAYQEALRQVVPLLYQGDYHVEIVVWATTPSPSAWTRAAQQAEGMVRELSEAAQLPASRRDRLSGVGRPWIDRDAKRPVLSLIVRKTAPKTADGEPPSE